MDTRGKEDAMLAVNCLLPAIDEARNDGREFDPKEDFVDLTFSVTRGPILEGDTLWLEVAGVLRDKKVGFRIGVTDKISSVIFNKEGQVANMSSTPNGLIMENTGMVSDSFVEELSILYGEAHLHAKMVKRVSFTCLALRGNPAEVEKQPVEFKLFFEKQFDDAESPEAREFYLNEYFEAYLNLDILNRVVHLNEKDQGYRRQLLNAFIEV